MALPTYLPITADAIEEHLAAVRAKYSYLQGIDMMAKDDDDADDLDDLDDGSDEDADDDADQDSGDDDEDAGEDDQPDLTDEELDELGEESIEEDGEDDAAGPGATKTIKTLRQYLKDHGIDPNTGKKKTRAEDIKGETPKGDTQLKQARVALKDLAGEFGFDSEYNEVLTKAATKVKFDEDGDLVKSSVKAIVAELRERKPGFFTTDTDDSDGVTTTTRKVPGPPKEKRAGVRNNAKVAQAASTIRAIEAKINSKQQLSMPEVSKLAADESARGKALYNRAADDRLLSVLGY